MGCAMKLWVHFIFEMIMLVCLVLTLYTTRERLEKARDQTDTAITEWTDCLDRSNEHRKLNTMCPNALAICNSVLKYEGIALGESIDEMLGGPTK